MEQLKVNLVSRSFFTLRSDIKNCDINIIDGPPEKYMVQCVSVLS